MTDRVKGLIVTLDQDIRIDDISPLIQAILQFRHVIDVIPSITNHNDWMNRMQVQATLTEKIWNALQENKT